MHSKDQFAIEIQDLFFSYLTPRKEAYIKGVPLPFKKVVNDKKIALNGINLKMEAGKITALLGRNGSGKTSLIKLISGTRTPDSGEIKIFGLPPLYARHRMGVCLGGTLIYHRLTARENLEYFGRLYNVPNVPKRIKELTDMLELDSVLDNMVETFSFGMKAKLAIARSLIHSPELLILDEPTLGIDLHLATQLRNFIRNLKCTVLLTTHYMEEAQELADDLCLIDKGKITDLGPKDVILGKYHAKGVSEAFLHATSA
jgi:ABC-type multidrug transport system ATPase subunit